MHTFPPDLLVLDGFDRLKWVEVALIGWFFVSNLPGFSFLQNLHEIRPDLPRESTAVERKRCVRNGNYDEALDLKAFVCKLSTMHPKLPVIQELAAEVRQTTQSLLSQLLQKLRANVQLPECLCIIGYLRRIGVFTESEMQLQFLRCREAWLAGILDDLDQRNVYEYLKGMVNCHRMHLFDVINQYRAIFADDTSGSEQNYDGGLLFS